MDKFAIECKVEKMTDKADRLYMRGDITINEYKAMIKDIDEWANTQFDEIASRAWCANV